MLQLTDEELLRYIKSSESEFNTLAEIHRLLIQNNILCGIEDLRQKILTLYRDGYLGNEPAGDGVNMYYMIFIPEYKTGSM
ncbi:MAG: hypothetical protein QHH06_00940 [Clostridiales bacterium]|jgi:hypothetical protein|nr:hypothetical protein [Eubacteriales bacterium]MDH7565035.1 hypothetical protein [Clostridiales bacterium]